MKKNAPVAAPLAGSRADQLLHAIALAMVRRQMQNAWPRR
jgi:hypothetical protein